MVLKQSRCEHPYDFSSDRTHLASEVLDVAVYLDLAFSTIKSPPYTFPRLNQVVDVLHRAADDAKVVFSYHRHVERWVYLEELLILELFVCQGIKLLERVLLAADLKHCNNRARISIEVVTPYSQTSASRSGVNLIFAESLSHGLE